jgi:hypothetical protein
MPSASEQSLELLPDEQVIETIHPHPLAFYRTYAIWIGLAVVAILFATLGKSLVQYLSPPDIKAPIEAVDNFFRSFGFAELGIDLDQPLELIQEKLVVILWWYFLIP